MYKYNICIDNTNIAQIAQGVRSRPALSEKSYERTVVVNWRYKNKIELN